MALAASASSMRMRDSPSTPPPTLTHAKIALILNGSGLCCMTLALPFITMNSDEPVLTSSSSLTNAAELVRPSPSLAAAAAVSAALSPKLSPCLMMRAVESSMNMARNLTSVPSISSM